MKYWKQGFYDEPIKGSVEIEDDYYNDLLEGQSEGKEIYEGDNGVPILVELEYSIDDTKEMNTTVDVNDFVYTKHFNTTSDIKSKNADNLSQNLDLDDVVVSEEHSCYTDPNEVEEFVHRTGIDSLAIAIGTSHGAYKFKPGTKPQLRFDILEDVEKRLPGFPIVLHGSSSVPQEFVRIINENGGNMPGAIGVPEDQLRKAASMAVCKINIDSDLRLAMTASIRSYLNAHPDHFDPRQYLKPARQAIKDMVAHKIVDVLGCNGKA